MAVLYGSEVLAALLLEAETLPPAAAACLDPKVAALL